MPPRLFVNVDHVATIRQARRSSYPDPVRLAAQAEDGGAHGITVHLREDRRHIQDDDVRRLRRSLRTPLNLELAVSEEIVRIALEVRPDQATLVPEKREEVTTEGGLDVVGGIDRIAQVAKRLRDAGTVVSLFIDPDAASVRHSLDAGVTHVELHTGRYADATSPADAAARLDELRRAAELARSLGLIVNAGHGLTLANTAHVAQIPGLNDLNIGHSLVADALECGLRQATRQMLAVIAQQTTP